MQSKCMKHEVKLQGRQVSFLIEDKRRDSYLDLMKKKIDSEEGKQLYSRRMWVIEPVKWTPCTGQYTGFFKEQPAGLQYEKRAGFPPFTLTVIASSGCTVARL